MLNVLATGGYDDMTDPEALAEIKDFTKCLGQEIIDQGHRLLNECQNQFDQVLAEGASEQLNHNKTELEDRVNRYKLQDTEKPAHNIGPIYDSVRKDWNLTRVTLDIPEVIKKADIIILVRGGNRSYVRANWARLANKPLLPVARFGYAARHIYEAELRDFDHKYANYLPQVVYQDLNRRDIDISELARRAVQLVEKLCLSWQAFVVMSFSDRDDLIDLSDTFVSCCEEFGYSCEKVNEDNTVTRIVPAIWQKIRSGAFVIVDLTVPSHNVYYELGYAEALGKELVVTAKEGTDLPFDIRDLPVIYWTNQRDLKERLRGKIASITAQQRKNNHR